ncbi:hypothetical protein METBIDRAFT_184571 [Metschnikowia bicuspidata var. bicuspidata NRRL YB-4993]|uniref:Uncharacterized protein n=1 Tax=Metschnikowia bicuspidata var. bicuspidata NRRL YB-4993 TaxID=869754 RepID=A0A1A0HBD3_9ASCO|nr:hypothetical protein METBIDRAFT_184571 [Metschnikowia bicuspidata var. bicuspidata NRRL YB-4993]OBA21444.1 hypothetical protein METBIDRAFT_184571 [Metschnikowia bicuspidata var. bicuspidata NRRL YB-4993]
MLCVFCCPVYSDALCFLASCIFCCFGFLVSCGILRSILYSCYVSCAPVTLLRSAFSPSLLLIYFSCLTRCSASTLPVTSQSSNHLRMILYPSSLNLLNISK